MYEFLAKNELYIVLSIVLICWLGLFIYLVRIDSKVSALEREEKE